MKAFKPKVYFKPKRGMDLKSSEQLRSEDYLAMGMNVCYDAQQNIIKRPGSQARSGSLSNVWGGFTKHKKVDQFGNQSEELLILGATTPKKVIKNTFTVTNASANPIVLTIGYSPSLAGYYLTLTGISIVTTTIALAGKTVANVIALMPIGVTATVTDAGTTLASYLDLVDNQAIPVGSSLPISVYSTEDLVDGMHVSPGYTKPTSLPNTLRAPIQTAYVSGSTYWYAGSRDDTTKSSTSVLMKYDGKNFYRAGLN